MALKELLKSLKSDKILIPKIEQYQISSNKQEEKGDGWIHPSGLGGCIRSQVFNCLGYPQYQALEPRTLRIFSNGDSMHTRFQKLLKKAGLLELCDYCNGRGKSKGDKCHYCRGSGVEKPGQMEEWRVRGHADGILTLKGRPMLELKSINTNGFRGLSGPNHGYLWQAHTYMKMLGLTETIFLFEDKNDQFMKEFVVKFDEEMWNSAFERIKEINKWTDKKILPKGDCGLEDIDSECRFSGVCEELMKKGE